MATHRSGRSKLVGRGIMSGETAIAPTGAESCQERQLSRPTARKQRNLAAKHEAPRAALLAETSAPPGATSVEGDPPLIDCPALTFSPTNVIARQSLRSGGRSRLLASFPGYPVTPPSVRPHVLGHPRLPDCGLVVLAVAASARLPR